MKYSRILLMIIIWLVISSCAAGPSHHWYKNDMSQFEQDDFDCRHKAYVAATQASGGNPFMSAAIQARIQNDCMKSKGYLWVSK